MFLSLLTLAMASLSSCQDSPAPAPILFLINSQPGGYHSLLADKSRQSILSQWKGFVPASLMKSPQVLLTSQMDPEIAKFGWTIFPLVEIMMIQMESEKVIDWIALLNENTEVDLRNLNEVVQKRKLRPREEALFFGRAVKDESPTIIHHFDPTSRGLFYPDLEAGIFLSRKLVYDLWERLKDPENLQQNKAFPDFNIDAAYEFSKFLDIELDVKLQNIAEICSKKAPGCLTYARSEYSCIKGRDRASLERILEDSLVAVKTCTKYHKERLGPVMATWGGLFPRLELISDSEDPEYKTRVLPYTINTENGHCNKTLAILEYFLQMETSPSFLVIVDDDTVLSVARLAQLLGCYDPEDSFLLGQKYGYLAGQGLGYNYITGGGGMILTRPAVSHLLSSSGRCRCPGPDTPDDMHLGRCAITAGVNILHSPRMFQARPPDYPPALLSAIRPISFHKHWEIDPVEVYSSYFRASDKILSDPEHKQEL